MFDPVMYFLVFILVLTTTVASVVAWGAVPKPEFLGNPGDVLTQSLGGLSEWSSISGVTHLAGLDGTTSTTISQYDNNNTIMIDNEPGSTDVTVNLPVSPVHGTTFFVNLRNTNASVTGFPLNLDSSHPMTGAATEIPASSGSPVAFFHFTNVTSISAPGGTTVTLKAQFSERAGGSWSVSMC